MLAAEDRTVQESFAAFLEDIDRNDFEPLPREEERQLVRRMNEGDEEARKQLIQHNLRYAIFESKRFRHLDLPYEDVVSAAIQGLIVAVDSYQLGHGTKLVSYARYSIRHRIQAALGQEGTVNHNAALKADAWRLKKARRKLKEQQGYITDRDLRRELEWPQKKLERVRKVANDQGVSLDASPYNEDEEANRYETLAPEADAEETARAVEETSRREYLEQVMVEVLTKRERRILVLYYGLDGGEEMTLDEVGQLHGITLERTRQLRNRALGKLEEAAGDALGEMVA